MNISEAVERVERKLIEFERGDVDTVHVYLWGVDGVDSLRAGSDVRVAEVDYQKEGAGASYMQVDLPIGLAVCAAVGRVLLALIEDWPQDELDDEWSRLETLVTTDWNVSERTKGGA